MIHVDVNTDSVSPFTGQRITTIVATYPRYIHSEVLTHRVFSRNSASSRAIPTAAMLRRIQEDPVIPIEWGANQRGMQAGEPVDDDVQRQCMNVWVHALNDALAHAESLTALKLHKQWANRIVEPWMHITTIITSTTWHNFFRLRCDSAAQPEFQALAMAIQDVIEHSEPREVSAHIPFLRPDDFAGPDGCDIRRGVEVATGRIGRVSYLTHEGKRDIAADRELHDKLLSDKHMSPFEHVAFAMAPTDGHRCANFTGWCQYRHHVDWPDNWADADHEPLASRYVNIA